MTPGFPETEVKMSFFVPLTDAFYLQCGVSYIIITASKYIIFGDKSMKDMDR